MTQYDKKFGPETNTYSGPTAPTVSGVPPTVNGPLIDADAGKFKVTTTGYSEQFTSRKKAQESYDRICKMAIKNERYMTIRFSEQLSGNKGWDVLQELKLNEDYYS